MTLLLSLMLVGSLALNVWQYFDNMKTAEEIGVQKERQRWLLKERERLGAQLGDLNSTHDRLRAQLDGQA